MKIRALVVSVVAWGWAAWLPQVAQAADAPAAPAGPGKQHDYAAASVTAPGTMNATQILVAWHGLVAERGLAPDLVDHREGLALGDWLVRPHVCSGSVRYHLVLLPGSSLKAVVLAECHGKGSSLDKAAGGLAEELAKKLSIKGNGSPTDVKEVPPRFWQARMWRGNTLPPEVMQAAGNK